MAQVKQLYAKMIDKVKKKLKKLKAKKLTTITIIKNNNNKTIFYKQK